MIRCTIPLSPTLATLAQESPMSDNHPTRESLGDMPIPRVKMTLDPEEAPAVPAEQPEPVAIDWRAVAQNNAERAEMAEASADQWRENYEVTRNDVNHARYKTALFVLAGCLLMVGALVLCLAHDLRRRVDQ